MHNRFGADDPVISLIKEVVKASDAVFFGLISDFVPWLKFLDRAKLKMIEKAFDDFNIDIIERELATHKIDIDYGKSVVIFGYEM